MYPPDIKYVHSYLESRGSDNGINDIVFFGLQYYLKEYLEGVRFTPEMVAEAQNFAYNHFGNNYVFNSSGWYDLYESWGGRLPIRIWAAQEGKSYPTGTPLMAIENTDPEFPWLTNVVETLLLKVWYPCSVATISRDLRKFFIEAAVKSSDNLDNVPFMVHDFGYRGASSEETAAIGGAAHLLSFMGTDTLAAIPFLSTYYGQNPNSIAYSVPASEHSIMTMRGAEGEIQIATRIIAQNAGRIVSIVADSYNYYNFVAQMIKLYDVVKQYNVKLVIRPDSTTMAHGTPSELVWWTLDILRSGLGAKKNSKGYNVVPYKVLWGDGLSPSDIKSITNDVLNAGYSVDNLVFGMGGGLLQKVNRDTFKFAIKCSSASTDGIEWFDVQKNPLDPGKKSKAGRQSSGLTKVFENGMILNSPPPGELRFNGL